MDKINGYKCFKEGLITNFGNKMKLDTLYEKTETPVWNNSGYHFCANMEDTFRFFDTRNENVIICKVTGYPEICSYDDEYNGYYDMYSCQKIVLNEVLTRKEIIEKALLLPPFSIERFSRDFCLTQEELRMFIDAFKKDYKIMCHLIYNYYNDKIYQLGFEDKLKMIEYYLNGEGKYITSPYVKKFKSKL